MKKSMSERYYALTKRSKEIKAFDDPQNHTEEFYDFLGQMKMIVQNKYAQTKNDKNIIQGTQIEAFAWSWLNVHQGELKKNAFTEQLNRVRIESIDQLSQKKKHKGQLNLTPKAKRRLAQQHQAVQNQKTMYRNLNLHVFQKPVDKTTHKFSLDRSEFSQYLNEPVHIFGKIEAMRVDDSNKRHRKYTKILLTNVQYFPTNPKYAFRRALTMSDHLWVDISNPEDRHRLYQKDDYVVFTGIVSEYESVARIKSLHYKRTKYGLSKIKYQLQGQPILDDNERLIDLKFQERPADRLEPVSQ